MKIEHLENLLTMLYRNGQILNNWIIEEYEKYRDTDVAIFGLYRREFLVIKSYHEYIYD